MDLTVAPRFGQAPAGCRTASAWVSESSPSSISCSSTPASRCASPPLLPTTPFCHSLPATPLQMAPAGLGLMMRNVDVALAFAWQVALFDEPPVPLSVAGSLLICSATVGTALRRFINASSPREKISAGGGGTVGGRGKGGGARISSTSDGGGGGSVSGGEGRGAGGGWCGPSWRQLKGRSSRPLLISDPDPPTCVLLQHAFSLPAPPTCVGQFVDIAASG